MAEKLRCLLFVSLRISIVLFMLFWGRWVINFATPRPSSPRNCTAKRIVSKDVFLSVRCLAGYDGGLHQHFLLEAVGDNSRVLANVTAGKDDLVVWLNTSWSVLETLTEDEVLTVSARNTKGASDPVMLSELVFKDAVKQTEETDRVIAKFPLAAAFAGSAAVVTAIGAIIALVFKKRHESSTTSKRPCQSVVQVDAQGRRYLIAYPTTHSQEKMETKPDILNPKHNEAEGPRVVLESSDNTSYIIRESNPLPHSTCLPHTPHEDMMPQR